MTADRVPAAIVSPDQISMVSVILVVGVALAASVFMAWTIGANSNSAPFAPAVGANALPVMRAALLVGVFASAGALLQGGAISDTVGRGLIRGVAITPLAAATALLTAASLITVGNRRGYPIPAAFTVTGAVVGVGLALGGAPATGTYVEIATFWLLIPVVAIGIALATALSLRRDDVPERVSVPFLAGLVGVVVANMRLSLIPSPSQQGALSGYLGRRFGHHVAAIGGADAVLVGASVAVGVFSAAAMRAAFRRRTVEQSIRGFLVVLGSLVVFSSGGTQVGLATGPLETIFDETLGLPGTLLIGIGALAILVGGWTGSPRVVQAVSREYSQLGERRSISALVPAFVISQTAIALGLPVSTNETIISSLIGSGLVEGSAGVSPRKIGYTVAFWLASLGLAAAIGFGAFSVFATLLGSG